jgi:YD repeat-containing protein
MKNVRGIVLMPALLWMLLVIHLLPACKKSGGPGSSSNNTGCTPAGETTGMPGNEASWQYLYDGKGNISTIVKLNKYGQQDYVIEVFANRVVRTSQSAIIKTVYNVNIFEALPTQAQVSLTFSGGVEQPNYYTYSFSYDSKNRLSKVSEYTAGVPNDKEWNLTISYNEKNNVTQLQYAWTTHPSEPVTTIPVSGYDDKPTPYTAVKYYKFLMNNYAWDNYDPEPVLTVLSANNPLDYTLNKGNPLEFKRTMSYTYNEQGFPTERTNTNKNSSGEATFKQTFSYSCK